MKRYFKLAALVVAISTMLSGCSGCKINVTPSVVTLATTTTPAITDAVDTPTVAPTVEPTKEVLLTNTPAVTSTEVVVPTEVPVVEPKDTPTPTAEATPELTLEPTATVAPTATPEPTNTPIPTATPATTNTPVPTPTSKSTATPKPIATPKFTPTPTPIPSVNGIKAGDYFAFGNYYQTRLTGDALTPEILNAPYNSAGKAVIEGKEYYKKPSKYYNQPNSLIGSLEPELIVDAYHYFVKEPIEWQVLDVRDGKAFVVSRYGLDRKQYHHEDCIGGDWANFLKVTWEMCDLRSWLGSVFYNEAFTEEEQESILRTKVTNPDNKSYGVDGGKDTYDYLYVLSNEETEKYFGREKIVDGLIHNGVPYSDYCNAKAYTQPTDYVKVQGVWNGSEPEWWDYLNCNYWLRTPGMDVNWASYIHANGSLMNGMSTMVTGHLIVRPCMWIDLATAEVEKVN